MFGPDHPRQSGQAGRTEVDPALPGFGPFGTRGQHCFDDTHPVYRRIAALAALRQNYPVLRYGRQYLRPTAFLGYPFGLYGPGEIVAWSRILDDEEALCVLNAHGLEPRGADVLVDADLNPEGSSLTVLVNTAQVIDPDSYSGTHPAGTTLPVQRAADGVAYVSIWDLQPSEVLVLTNRP
jgi:hypothetical protein